MAATFKTESHGGSTTNTTSTVVTKPNGTVDGDLLIAIIGKVRGNDNRLISSVPSGWSQIHVDFTDDGLGYSRLYAYAKVASSEPNDWTWGWDGIMISSWGCYRIEGFDPAGAITTSAIAHANNGTSPSYTNTVTPTIPQSLILMSNWFSSTTSQTISGQAVTTSNPTWTEVAEQSNASGCGTLSLAWAIRPETTATGNSTATISGTDNPYNNSLSSIIVVSRITAFTATIEDTTTNTEMVVMQKALMNTQTDILALSETVETTKGRLWNKTNKPSTTWNKKLK